MIEAQKPRAIDSLVECRSELISHACHARHYQRLHQMVSAKIRMPNTLRQVVMLVGPARVGKSHLLEELDLEFGKAELTEAGRKKQLLYVRVPEGGAAGSTLREILRRLGEPYNMLRSTDELLNRVKARLLAMGVQVLILDDVHHFADEGRRASIRAGSDFLKGLIEENPQVTMIFSGIPLASRLREENPQMRGRCDAPDYYLPYNWDEPEEQQAFIGAVYPIYCVVSEAMKTEQIDTDRFIKAMYLLGGGCFGFVMKFLESLINMLEQKEEDGTLTLQDLGLAFQKKARDSVYMINPFESREPISDVMLSEAWRQVMIEHDLKKFITAGSMVGATR